MSQTPRDPSDDLRLSDEEIRAMSEGLRRQYTTTDDRGMAGAVGSAVANTFEGMIRRILLLLRLPLILIAAVAGFLFLNGREGVTFLIAVAAAVISGVVAATLINVILRYIDLRGYRREIG